MKKPLVHALAALVLAFPGVTNAKGSHMDIRATVWSFKAVGDSLEIVFSGTISHVSGDGPSEDDWGFSARVKKTKLIIPDRKLACFFTLGSGPMKTHNLKDDLELGSGIYGRTGRQIWIAAYSPEVHFEETIARIVSGSVCLAIMNETMSNTQTAPEKPDGDKPSN
jgi:hypothetical protein